VGNVSVGGAGKTPVSAWMAARLAERGGRPAVVLRGYGRDEILVHRELNPEVPVYADSRRVRAAALASRDGCDVVVLDDGFQHRALARDLDILLVGAETWTPTRRLLPRGPWREDMRAAARADLVMVTRKSTSAREAEALCTELERLLEGRLPVLQAAIEPRDRVPLHGGPARPLDTLAGTPVLAVAALAWPEPFVANLAAAGAQVELAAFPDHHEFTPAEARSLAERAAGRPVVVTLKDAVKLRSLWTDEPEVWVLRQAVRLEWGENVLDRRLDRVLTGGAR
jgi:tetraacyldisaccharide 4'-kinase